MEESTNERFSERRGEEPAPSKTRTRTSKQTLHAVWIRADETRDFAAGEMGSSVR